MPLSRWLRRLRRARALERDMDEEMRFHLEMEAAELAREGRSPEEALREARLRFGGIEGHKEAARDGRPLRVLEDAGRDVRYALRVLRASPAYTGAAVLSLALGIGAATVLFGVNHAVLFHPLPFRDPDRLAVVWSRAQNETGRSWLSAPEVEDVRRGAGRLEGVAALRDWTFHLTGRGESRELQALAVSANLFSTLGVRPALGRAFLPAEDRPGSARVVVASHAFWAGELGGDPAAVGRTLTLNGEPYTLVGVMPRGFRILPLSSVFPRQVDVWVPFAATLPAWLLEGRDVQSVHVIGRLGDGATPRVAQAELDALAAALREEHPEAYDEPGWGFEAVPLPALLTAPVRPALTLLLGAVVLLLGVVCANVAGLNLARGTARSREMAVRLALGAGRGRLVRQLLAESLVLALAGGALGLLLATWGTGLLRRFGPRGVPRLDELVVDGRVALFALLASLAAAVLSGLVPALRATSPAAGALGERGVAAGRTRLRSALVAGELAAAVVLASATGLLGRSLARLGETDPGFRPERVLTARVSLPAHRYHDGPSRAAFFAELSERLATAPGVRAAGAVTHLPLSGAYLASPFQARGSRAPGAAEEFSADLRGVTPGYFAAMRIPLLAGRAFTEADTRDAAPVAIVDETLARRWWPGEDAVGKTLLWKRGDQELTVVGVARHVRHYGLEEEGKEQVYRPYAQYANSASMTVALRSAGPPEALAGVVRAEVARLDRAPPVSDVRTMEALVGESLGPARFHALSFGAFGAFALVLAAVGVYGVVAYSVSARTREIGVRLALGARPGDVVRLVMREGVGIVAAGVAIGAALALLSARLIAGLLHGVSPTDPGVLAGVAALLAATGLLSALLPAARAARVEPGTALRAE